MSALAQRAVQPGLPGMDAFQILQSLPEPILVVEGDGTIVFVNLQAQHFFEAGEIALVGRRLDSFVPADSPMVALIDKVFVEGHSMAEFGVTLETPRIGRRAVSVTVGPMGDPPTAVVLALHEVSIARRIDNQLTHRNAARSVTAMAAMLAHEVKNPLSGIRGAAQLLEQDASEADQVLTRLICDEADRIVALVNRMEDFGESRPTERGPVNIHMVLEHVRRLAQSGFARHVRFVEHYDPSLPPVFGNRDHLVQVMLNLIKNAAEAVPADGGEIVLSTAYQRGVSVAVPGTEGRMNLPIAVSVRDNGEGIPEDLRAHLFDPFVTTKQHGTGLGLALVAKIVGDHGGVIEFDSRPQRTDVRLSLPIHVDRPAPSAAREQG